MFQRTVDVLEQQTKDFWKLSNLITGRSKVRITVMEAIDKTNELSFTLGPQRRLRRAVELLSDVIIQGKRSKKKNPATVTILSNNKKAVANA